MWNAWCVGLLFVWDALIFNGLGFNGKIAAACARCAQTVYRDYGQQQDGATLVIKSWISMKRWGQAARGAGDPALNLLTSGRTGGTCRETECESNIFGPRNKAARRVRAELSEVRTLEQRSTQSEPRSPRYCTSRRRNEINVSVKEDAKIMELNPIMLTQETEGRSNGNAISTQRPRGLNDIIGDESQRWSQSRTYEAHQNGLAKVCSPTVWSNPSAKMNLTSENGEETKQNADRKHWYRDDYDARTVLQIGSVLGSISHPIPGKVALYAGVTLNTKSVEFRIAQACARKSGFLCGYLTEITMDYLHCVSRNAPGSYAKEAAGAPDRSRGIETERKARFHSGEIGVGTKEQGRKGGNTHLAPQQTDHTSWLWSSNKTGRGVDEETPERAVRCTLVVLGHGPWGASWGRASADRKAAALSVFGS
ncbi:hypothetical protein B0H14DRAFT_2567888 [Mycena olivaceomarginata]|nr:hypothetical protein B0H14DRAFT_2567888 [Mycena olivaceomarginata]